jgi:hypothetical protein
MFQRNISPPSLDDRHCTFSGLHDIITQKTVHFIATALRTSSPTNKPHGKVECSGLGECGP